MRRLLSNAVWEEFGSLESYGKGKADASAGSAAHPPSASGTKGQWGSRRGGGGFPCWHLASPPPLTAGTAPSLCCLPKAVVLSGGTIQALSLPSQDAGKAASGLGEACTYSHVQHTPRRSVEGRGPPARSNQWNQGRKRTAEGAEKGLDGGQPMPQPRLDSPQGPSPCRPESSWGYVQVMAHLLTPGEQEKTWPHFPSWKPQLYP